MSNLEDVCDKTQHIMTHFPLMNKKKEDGAQLYGYICLRCRLSGRSTAKFTDRGFEMKGKNVTA